MTRQALAQLLHIPAAGAWDRRPALLPNGEYAGPERRGGPTFGTGRSPRTGCAASLTKPVHPLLSGGTEGRKIGCRNGRREAPGCPRSPPAPRPRRGRSPGFPPGGPWATVVGADPFNTPLRPSRSWPLQLARYPARSLRDRPLDLRADTERGGLPSGTRGCPMEPCTPSPGPAGAAPWQRAWLDSFPCDTAGTLPYPRVPVSALLETAA